MEDVPLVKLAKRVLSICANSASCERLFSIFGNTLTKLRNRLGTTTLTNLAELKMLIRDDHLNAGNAKDWLKRKFGKTVDPVTTSALDSAAAATSSTPQSSESQHTSPAASGQPSNDTNFPLDPSLNNPDIDPKNEFTSMMSQMEKMVDTDKNVDGTPSFPAESISVTLADLFNFNSTDWVTICQRNARRSLLEEQELYELMDKDSAGLEGGQLGIDAHTEAVIGI